MPVYQLTEELVFPNPEWANPEGLLAVGGDLSLKRLLLAYQLGIFPWYSDDSPILWWSPPQRCVIDPDGFHISRSLRRLLRQERFTVTLDRAFEEVVYACAETRIRNGEGTWITPAMLTAYCTLHEAGFAHSAETWDNGELVGGIYGVSLGRAFFRRVDVQTRGQCLKSRLLPLNAAAPSMAVSTDRLSDRQSASATARGV